MSADKQTRRNNKVPPSDFRRLSRRFMSGLLRSLFLINNRSTRYSRAGFVLPTTVLLLLIVTLTAGTLSYRAFSRTSNVIALREQQVVDSSAAPAVDRAKAKLEYLFSKDARFPGGVPSSDVLASMMLNDGKNGIPKNKDIELYDFPGETRIDINGDKELDNAWVFTADVNGDGNTEDSEIVVYSVLMDDLDNKGTTTVTDDISLTDDLSKDKAKALVTRNGPITVTQAQAGCSDARAPEAGWQVVSQATLEKNFQVTAFVANESDIDRTAAALEFQQVRQANRGNKWGAWFKYDLELFPGASRQFFWNGAMHTEGNLLSQDFYTARMISSHNSCLYTQDSAEITVADYPASDGQPAFQGQIMSAKTGPNSFSSGDPDPGYHLFTDYGKAPKTTNSSLTTANDSVSSGSSSLRDILLDPIQLFTKDVLAHRGANSSWSHDGTWEKGEIATAKRIYNDGSATPYLDDTYRADNRYGPKPVYDSSNKVPDGTAIGTPIVGNSSLTAFNATDGLYGLDGYWERRAIGQGLRIIVGQRLELGNTFGWKGNEEPLYPATAGTTMARQRRSLNDNLAAVQGMVVYHYEYQNGQLPLACIASTAHPGTQQTIVNSRTFNTIDINGTPTLDIDFFNGVGTNGWEFTFPYTSSSAFSSAIASDKPLGKVLRNLSYFAGDPKGGAPSFEPSQDDGEIHPAPYMAAWGDFSKLRRIFKALKGGTAYAALSPADKSTLHSAACTIGMLSHSLNNELQLASNFDAKSVQALGNHIDKMIDGDNKKGAGADIDTFFGVNDADDGQPVLHSGAKGRFGFGAGDWEDTTDNSEGGANPRAGCTTDTLGTGDAAYNPACDAADYYGQFTSSDFYRALKQKKGLGGPSLLNKFLEAQAILTSHSQFDRDRRAGFRRGGLPALNGSNTTIWDSETGLAKNLSPQLVTGCDPDIFTAPTSPENTAVALAICQDAGVDVKYPSLYYLFPPFEHGHDGADDSSKAGVLIDHRQPPNEEYIKDTYVSKENGVGKANYVAVSNADIEALATSFAPKATTSSGWTFKPSAAAEKLTDPDDNDQEFTINVGANSYDVVMLDKGMYDGRELLNLRMLDLDIDKLSSEKNVSDHWIAEEDGIVYAFREDAVREDGIVREKVSGTQWTDCDTWSEVYENKGGTNSPVIGKNRSCRMSFDGGVLKDPPLMDDSKISTKPIDFYADPDRRPHGFRLLHGETLNRKDDVLSGMTFVSDNMVYIKGDFNLHSATGALSAGSNACGALIEEFTDKIIADDCTDRTQHKLGNKPKFDFYNDRTVDERNPDNFANPEVDHWRPVEIVGDAVGILSKDFNDGNVEDGFVLDRTQGQWGYGISSYQNQNRVEVNDQPDSSGWLHAGPDTSTPVLVGRNGEFIKVSSGGTTTTVPDSDFILFDGPGNVSNTNFNDYNDKRGGDLQPATRTIANAVFISGIIPSQAGQTYGGMHNFPRFLEHWRDVDLHVSGGFFQLNFSTSATAPFDQDAWEPGRDPILGKKAYRTRFYGAPNRIWGYDVGLQYAPAAPIARRFVTVGRPRSEFYRELPVEDPYVNNLRCATFNGKKIDETATCS